MFSNVFKALYELNPEVVLSIELFIIDNHNQLV